MNEDDIRAVLMKAAVDQDFRNRFFRDPRAAANELGVQMSDEEAASISGYVHGMRQRAERGQKILIYPFPKIVGTPGGTRRDPDPKPKDN